MGIKSSAMKTEDNLSKVRIIVFTRFPVPGHVKTRLIPELGADGAAKLQRRMTEFTVKQIRQTGIKMDIRFTGGSEFQVREWLGPDGKYTPQGAGDLGARMERAFKDAFNEGAEKVLVVGSDCPDNRAANMLKALKLLNDRRCVLGPATDGGYYLIGLSEPRPGLFRDVDWGTERVLKQTVEKLDHYTVLPALNDVDDPGDVPLQISVIIPAINEENFIQPAVEAAMNGFYTETIVADGGSGDRTREIALQAGARVIQSRAGRAIQMNVGAQHAKGDIFVFLHADSFLPPGWDYQVRRVMKQPRVILGYFDFAINGSFPGKQWIEWGANVRSRLLKRPYGDQGLFIRRNDFFDIGGFPEVPILEDVLFVKQARGRGMTGGTGVPLPTSGRRWLKYGVINTTIFNQMVLIAACLGADLENLRDIYRKGKNPLTAFLHRN